MAKPQPLPQPLPTDLAQVKALLDSRYTEKDVLITGIQEKKGDVEAYDKQIKVLQIHAKQILKIEQIPPKIKNIIQDQSEEI